MSDAAIPPEANGLLGGSGTMDLALRAAEHGAADARDAADRAVASAGLFLARFVYTTCYTVSYGVVFPSVLLARSIPRDNAAVRGVGAGETRAATVLARADAPAVPA